jgi:3-methylcrotonyl-CoA carboxylase alpha subunit
MNHPNTNMLPPTQTGFAAGPPQGKTRPPRGAGSDTKCTTVGAI